MASDTYKSAGAVPLCGLMPSKPFKQCLTFVFVLFGSGFCLVLGKGFR